MKKISTICVPMSGDFVYLAPKNKGFGAGKPNGYGGRGEGDESPEQVAVREWGEESDTTITEKDLDKVGVIDFYDGQNHLFECHIYIVRRWDGELKATEEMGTPEMYHKDALPLDRMWEADRYFFPITCSGKRFKHAIGRYKEGMNGLESFVVDEW
jgi:8-oxo-dGTP pyrophosphatase MutT (NUDIX family)